MLNIDISKTLAGRQLVNIGVEKGKKLGIEKGKKVGVKEGKKEGKKEGVISVARNMSKEGLNRSLIQKFHLFYTFSILIALVALLLL